MVRVSTLRSGAFRFAVLIALVFAAGSTALLAVVDRAVSHYAGEVATDAVTAELEVLVDEDRSSGPAQAVRSIVRRENATREHDLRYLLLGRAGRPLAGSLPPTSAMVGWHRITVRDGERDHSGRPTVASLTILGARLGDGALLVVGSDNSDLERLRRLGAVNSSVERIMAGSFAERLPMIGMSAELTSYRVI